MDALYRYWGKYPPVHKLVAAYIGYEGGSGKKSFADFVADIEQVKP